MKIELTSRFYRYNKVVDQYPSLRYFSPSIENSRLYIDIEDVDALWLLTFVVDQDIILCRTKDRKKQIQISDELV